jgi:hypothetical protein
MPVPRSAVLWIIGGKGSHSVSRCLRANATISEPTITRSSYPTSVQQRCIYPQCVVMSENPLVALAGAMRTALSTSLETAPKDKASQRARLDIIDMIPDLQRALTGERDTIRNMTWSVKISTTYPRYPSN